MGEWISGDDVVRLTGREATEANIVLAETIVEIFAGVSTVALDDETIATRNLLNLQRAMAFQAVWLGAHPDVVDAMDVEGVSQDGLSATYANANAHLLAPLASRCIMRLTWRSGPIRVGRARQVARDRGNRDSAVRDDQYVWTPMGSQ